jgi:hypothetical protein
MLKRRQRRYQENARRAVHFTVAVPTGKDVIFLPDRLACERDIPLFGKTYIPDYVTAEYAPHHFLMFQAMQTRTSRIVLVLLPRGAGKSTILFLIALHAVCYSLEPYIVQIEHDGDLAGTIVQKFVKVFEENQKVIHDFPDVRPSTPWSPSSGELNFTNGCIIRFMGLNQLKSRGSTHHEHRITLAICNDLVDLKNAKSRSETKFIYDMITKDLAKAGPLPGEGILRRCYLGTSISQTDAAWQLSQSPMVKVIKIPAINGHPDRIKQLMAVISEDARHISDFCDQIEREKEAQLDAEEISPEELEITDRERWAYIRANREKYAPFFAIPDEGDEDGFLGRDGALQSYWPEVYSMAFFVFDAAEDTGAFMQERQHVTSDAAFQKVFREWFVPYDGTLPRGLYRFGLAIDTSGEPKEGTDPMAIVAGAFNLTTRDLYILEVWSDQATPEKLLSVAHEIYWRQFRTQDRTASVFLEAIVSAKGLGRSFFQQGAENAQHRHPSRADFWDPLPVKEVPPGGNKDLRLLAIRPELEQQRIHVMSGHSQQDLLVTQWCGWIPGTNTHKLMEIEYKIDTADAMTMLYTQLQKRPRKKPAQSQEPRRNQPPARSAYDRFRHR